MEVVTLLFLPPSTGDGNVVEESQSQDPDLLQLGLTIRLAAYRLRFLDRAALHRSVYDCFVELG